MIKAFFDLAATHGVLFQILVDGLAVLVIGIALVVGALLVLMLDQVIRDAVHARQTRRRDRQLTDEAVRIVERRRLDPIVKGRVQ